MQRTMKPLVVNTSRNGTIQIAQCIDDGNDYELSIIELSPDQVETLIAWLKDARAELQLDQAVSSICEPRPEVGGNGSGSPDNAVAGSDRTDHKVAAAGS